MSCDQTVEHRKINQLATTDFTESTHHKRPESDGIASGPWLWNEAQGMKLEWQLCQGIERQLAYVAIDSAQVGVEDLLFLCREGRELGVELGIRITGDPRGTVSIHHAR